MDIKSLPNSKAKDDDNGGGTIISISNGVKSAIEPTYTSPLSVKVASYRDPSEISNLPHLG